jgi:DNA-binding NtrC family response regulator
MSGLREKQRVLVIDDEVNVSDTLALIFTKEGYEARVAYSAEDAIEVIADWRPDVAIIDVVLPGMNGIDFALVLKANYPDCGLLLFSGETNTADLLTQAAKEGNLFDILAKPLHPAYMLSAAAGLLGDKPKGMVEN